MFCCVMFLYSYIKRIYNDFIFLLWRGVGALEERSPQKGNEWETLVNSSKFKPIPNIPKQNLDILPPYIGTVWNVL